MKHLVATIVIATVAAIGGHGEESMSANDDEMIRFRFGSNEIVVSLVDNSATRSLVGMLPLSLEFQDYAASEKISYPAEKLDTSDVPEGYDPSVGDLTYYAPWGDLAFFYRDHGYARGLVPLGTIVSGVEFLGKMDRVATVLVEAIQ